MSMRHRRKSLVWWKVLIGLIFATVLGVIFFSGNYCPQCAQEEYDFQKYSFERILNYYDFTTSEQKSALKDLFVMSSLASENDSWEKIFPSDQRIANILNFVTNTQWKFSNRFGRERWEVSEQPWLTENREKILADMRILGFIDEISPHSEHFDAVCVLGANTLCMDVRLKFLAELLENKRITTATVVLLTGERYVNNIIDGSEEELQAMAEHFGIDDWRKLTETKVFDYLYEKSPLKNMGLNVVIIDTPRGELPRPTTKTTMAEFKKWLRENPKVKKVLFISNQPYILYQKTIIENELISEIEVFEELEIDAAGPAVPQMLQDHMQIMIEGLGSYIWAKSPSVLKKII